MNEEKASWKLSDEEKSEVVKLWKSGLSTFSISKKFNCNDEPIRNLIKRRIPEKLYKTIVSEHMKRFEEKNKLKIITTPNLNEELAWWVGVVKGDGYVGKYSIVLGVRDKEFRDRWTRVGERLFNIKAKIKTIIRENKEFYLSYFNSVLLIKFLKENYGQFGRYVWDIPKNMENEPKIIFSFLKGLFDSEGSMKFRARKGGSVITLVSVNKNAIFHIERILDKSKIKCRISLYRRKDRINDYYVICIGGFNNIAKFAKNINFSIKRKRDKIYNYLNYIILGEDDIAEN